MDIVLQVGVKALLKNKEGKYLLLKRSKDKYKEVHNLWDIPGGRIDPGTPLMENLKREILEETQLSLIDQPRLVAAQDILKVPARHVVRLTYVGTIDGDPQLDQQEHVDYKWVTVGELKTIEGLDSYITEVINSGILES